MRDDASKIIGIFLLLGFIILFVNLTLDTFTGMVTGLPYEQGYEDGAICWGNATFDCTECLENCTDYGCNYLSSSCSGEPEGSCGDYPDNRQCGHAGCTWNEEGFCEGELLCSNFEDLSGCNGVSGCSWNNASCEGEADCLSIGENIFCGLASECEWMESNCMNDEDDDNDGLTDCADADCDGYFNEEGLWYCEYGLELSCDDGYDNNGDGNTDSEDSDCLINPLPDYNGFLGRTTNFSAISDLDNVSNLILENFGNGLIEWNQDGLNVSYMNFSRDVIIGEDFIFINSSNLNDNLNSSANLTIFNVVGFSEIPAILMDGEYCIDCNLTEYDGENISFVVPHFTNYSLGSNSELLIYDEFEGSLTYNGTNITFFANYTNRTNDLHISGAICNISFDDGTSAMMDEGFSNYNYTKSNGFEDIGLHEWNVTCNLSGFEELTSIDNVTLVTPTEEYDCSNVDYGIWNKTFGGAGNEVARDIKLTNDCGFIISGDTTSYGNGDKDIWILKLNSTGDLQWNKTFGTAETDNGYSIEEFSDGSFVAAGFKETAWSFGKIWILKLNSTGDLQWNKTFGISQSVARDIVETSDGDIAVAGYTNDYGAGSYDYWILKLNSTGDLQWNTTFGETSSDRAYSMVAIEDGLVVMGGDTYDLFNQRVGIKKLDNDGNSIWNSTINQFNEGVDIISLDSGGFVVSGNDFIGSNPGSYDLFIVGLNSSRDLQWSKTFGGTALEYGGYSMETSGGDIALIGYTFSYSSHPAISDIWLLKLNSSGDLIYNTTIGGSNSDYASGLIELPDEKYVILGTTYSYGNGGSDFWIISDEFPAIELNDNGEESTTARINSGSSSRGCAEDWECSDWGECIDEGIQYRECMDLNECGSWNNKPNESEECDLKFKLMDVQWDQLVNGQDFNVGEMMRLRVLFPEREYHIVDVYGINDGKVILDIASRLKRIEYIEGTIKQFDVNGDDILDFEIWVKEIYDEHATINVKYLNLSEEKSVILSEKENKEVYARYKKEDGNWIGMAWGNFLEFDIFTWLFILLILSSLFYFGWKKWKHD